MRFGVPHPFAYTVRMSRPPGTFSPLADQSQLDSYFAALTAGNGIETAAAYAGLIPRTVWRWLARGKDAASVAEDNGNPIPAEEREYVDFAARTSAARAQAKVRNVQIIQTAARLTQVVDRQGNPVFNADGSPVIAAGDWKAAAWMLERTYPDEYGPKQRTELTGAGGGPLELHQTGQIDLEVGFAQAIHVGRAEAIHAALVDAGLVPALPVPDDDILDGEVVDDDGPGISFT